MTTNRLLASLLVSVSFLLLVVAQQQPASDCGFFAQYFDSGSGNDYSYQNVFKTKVTERQDTTVNFDYGSNWNVLPTQLATKKTNFAVRWSAWLIPTDTDSYSFGVKADDGLVLTLDDSVLLNKWGPQADTFWSAPLPLVAGSKYKLKLEYFQATGGAQVVLSWKGKNTGEQVIPTTNVKPLNPATEKTTTVSNSKGWRASFFKSTTSNTDMSYNARFSHYQTDRLDSDVNYPDWDQHWDTRGLPALGTKEHFATRWNGLVTAPNDDSYTLFMKADDGVKVSINGVPVITGQSWNQVQKVQEYTSIPIKLKAKAQFAITVEYFQLQQESYSQLMWSSAKFPKSIIGSSFVQPIDTSTVLKVVPFNGKRYAVLDGTEMSATKPGKQVDFRSIPAGWNIASDTAATKLVAASGKWGSDGVVIQNGKVVKTGTFGDLIAPTNGNLETMTDDASPTFRPNANRNNRILIESPTLAPSDTDTAVPTINKWVTFKKKKYAVLDGATPTDKKAQNPTNSDVTNKFHKVPSGWKVAPKDSQSSAILMANKFTFGAKQLVTSDGVAYSTTGLPQQTQQIETQTSDNGDAFLRPVLPDQKILVTTDDTTNQPDSWNTAVAPTNVIRVRNGNSISFYATMDNSRVDDASYNCQDLPYTVPAGWKLATNTPQFQNVLNQNLYQFGTRCLVFADGNGYLTVNTANRNCGSNLLQKTTVPDTGDLYAPSDCTLEKKILIQKDTTLDNLAPTDLCGTCTFAGDPHISTFSGAAWTFPAIAGQYIYLKPKGQFDQSFRIWTEQTPWSSVDTISKLYVKYGTEVLIVSVQQNGPNGYAVSRNGKTIDPASDSDPNAQISITPVTSNIRDGEDASFNIKLPNGILIQAAHQWWSNINLLNIYLYAPNSLRASTEGICGSCGEDTLAYSDGRTTSKAAGDAAFSDFANSWKFNGEPGISKRQAVTPTTPTGTNEKPRNGSVESVCANPQKRAFAEWLCNGLLGNAKRSCLVDFCVSGSPSVVKSSEQTDAVERSELVNETVVCKTVPITNFVSFQGLDFAVLDNTPIKSQLNGGQTDYYTIPDGWEIAPDTALTRAFISCSSFGTTCLTLKHGLALSRDLKKCHSNFNLRVSKDMCYRPIGLSRILLVKSLPTKFIPDDSAFFAADPTTGLAKGWAAVGKGYTLTNNTAFGGSGIKIKGLNKELAGATFSGTYKNHQRFTVGVWSAVTLAQATALVNVEYGLKVELVYSTGKTEVAGHVGFNSSVTEFNYRAVEVVPTGEVDTVKLTLYVEGFDNFEVTFSALYVFTQMHKAGNLLHNPSVYNSSAWSVSTGSGFSVDYHMDHTGYDKSGSLVLSSSAVDYTDSQDYVALQAVRLTAEQQKNIRGVYFSGWSRQDGVAGSPSSGYSIFVNIRYTDKTKTSGVIAPFDNVVDGWQFSERVFKIAESKVIEEIRFAVVLRKHVGVAYFDDLYLTTLPCADFSSKSIDIGAAAVGLGHVVTISGRVMDLNWVGDFSVYQDASLSVVGRSVQIAPYAVAFGAVNILFPGVTIQIERSSGRTNPVVKIDGQVQILVPENAVNFGKTPLGSIVMVGSLLQPPRGNRTVSYYLDFPSTGHKIVITATVGGQGKQWLQIFPKPPLEALKLAKGGLLGKYDPSNPKSVLDGLDNVQPQSYTPSDDDTMAFKVGADSKFQLDNPDNQLPPSKYAKVPNREFSAYSSSALNLAAQSCEGVALNEICMDDFLSLNADSGLAYSYGALEELITSAEPSKFVLSFNMATDDELKIDKKYFIIGAAVVGGVVLVVMAVLVAVIIKKNQQAKAGYTVMMS